MTVSRILQHNQQVAKIQKLEWTHDRVIEPTRRLCACGHGKDLRDSKEYAEKETASKFQSVRYKWTQA